MFGEMTAEGINIERYKRIYSNKTGTKNVMKTMCKKVLSIHGLYAVCIRCNGVNVANYGIVVFDV